MDPVAVRAERIERKAFEDVLEAVPPACRLELGLKTRQLGSALVVASSGTPDPVFNRTLGLGVEEPVTEDALEEAVALLRGHAGGRFFVQLHPDSAPRRRLGAWLHRLDLRRYHRGWMRLVRDCESVPESPTRLRIASVSRGEAAVFGAIFARGFELPEALGQVAAALVGRPRWRCFLAYDGTLPVGTGACFVDGANAWLGFGATLAEARGRGAQSALLAARVAAARDAGCSLVASETGEPVGGTPNPSGDNMQRLGFRVAYVRPNWVAAS